MKEIDLREGVFAIQEDYRMLLGYCTMIWDGEVVYAGRLDGSPNPKTGWLVILHPDDFEEINDIFRKDLN